MGKIWGHREDGMDAVRGQVLTMQASSAKCMPGIQQGVFLLQ